MFSLSLSETSNELFRQIAVRDAHTALRFSPDVLIREDVKYYFGSQKVQLKILEANNAFTKFLEIILELTFTKKREENDFLLANLVHWFLLLCNCGLKLMI